jgi:ATP-dependent helicase/nuclease subunit A
VPGTRAEEPSSRPSAADVGTAHHRFLQFVALDRVRGVGELRQEAARLEHQRLLSANEIALLDFDALAAFWNSGFGRSIAEIRSVVRRELAFTTRIPAGELLALTGQPAATGLETEFVIVQGVVDLAVILPAEIRLVDFKTDRMRADELTQKTRLYEPQLKLYARALERIYQRPVTDCRLHFFSPRTTVRVDKK